MSNASMRRLTTGTVVKIKLFAYDKACRITEAASVSFVCPMEYNSLSFDAATVLAKHLKLLDFPGLSRLTPRVAQALAGQRGTLILSGIVSLEVETALALSKHEGSLALDRLKTLDVDALAALGQHCGPVSLASLTLEGHPQPEMLLETLAHYGVLQYDHSAIDVFENVDFEKASWARITRCKPK